MARWIATVEALEVHIGSGALSFSKGGRAMNIRFSRLATGVLFAAAVVLMSARGWAIYYGLGPSKDEWGLKYDVAVNEADSTTLTVEFTLADEGRLKPFFSLELVAFSPQADSQGRRSYDVKAPIELKPTKDGKRVGQVQIRKDFANRAKIRILTHMVDGKRQPSGGSYYDIPIAKYLSNPSSPPPIASQPRAKAAK
jgi:hypothetical protein